MVPLKRIVDAVSGSLTGNGDTPIFRIAAIREAQDGDITFLTDTRYRKYLKESQASAVIVGEDVTAEGWGPKNVVTVKNPALAYIAVAELLSQKKKEAPGISPLACTDENASISEEAAILPYSYVGSGTKIGRGTVVHPFCYVGNDVTIGDDCILYPNVTLYQGVKVGNRVIIHSGTVIGSDGFGYVWDGQKHAKIPQIGIVEIQDEVEIGANVAIDRASLASTFIGKGTKIDNLVQVAHNVTIGEHSVIIAQVAIGGSAKIGRNVVLAGQVAVRDHVVVGDFVKAGGQTGISEDVPPGSLIFGTPHMPHKQWMRLHGYWKRLPSLFERMKQVEDKLQPEDKNG
jgi:UDP-3-O-[3-hydroxymyristoyl] glucosamine N-acyltransferase